MFFILLLTFILIFVFYALSSENIASSFAGFILGAISGIVSVFLISLFSFKGISASPFFWTHVFEFFFEYFFLNLLLGLACFFVLSFSLSEGVLRASFSSLLGIFTVVMCDIYYENINSNFITMLVLFAAVSIGSVLIFEFLFSVLTDVITFTPEIVIYIISLLVFSMIIFLGCIALTMNYFSENSLLYLSIAFGIFFTGIILKLLPIKK